MSRRIDWERRKFDGKRSLSVKDEGEFRGKDLAARWIQRAEAKLASEKAKKAAERAKPITTPRKSTWTGVKLKPGEPPF
jgi:hypothetical protein